jgi:hypothetical protein
MFNSGSKEHRARANYICLMTMKDYNGKFSIYILTMKNSFDVAPDLLIWRNSKILGGFFIGSQ